MGHQPVLTAELATSAAGDSQTLMTGGDTAARRYLVSLAAQTLLYSR